MRFAAVSCALAAALSVFAADNPASKLWDDLKEKRSQLPGVHQEFELSQSFKTAAGGSQSSKRDIVLDMFQSQWREMTVSGSGSRIRIFDGTDVLTMENGDDEFVRLFARLGGDAMLAFRCGPGSGELLRARRYGFCL